MKILMKLKESSKRDFLVTQSGYTITKDGFVEVDDNDQQIEGYVMFRNDIEVKDIGTEEQKPKQKKPKKKSTQKKVETDIEETVSQALDDAEVQDDNKED